MFNNHIMILATDLAPFANEIQNFDHFIVAAITSNEIPTAPNIYYAGILMPPTELLMRWCDAACGSPDAFVLQSEYPRYLDTIDCDNMIVAILAAMTKRNVILYIPLEEFKVYGDVLLQHIAYRYCIVLQTAYTPFSVNPAMLPLIASKFYMLGVMDADVYLSTFPANYSLPDWVIQKLAIDIHPFATPATFEQYRDYFNQINASKGQPKKMPLIRLVDKEGDVK